MSRSEEIVEAGPTLVGMPAEECDVIMKGGITSGVVYPEALCAIGATYRIRGIGGASAGAIGAAVGAAAEFGRSSGGFDRLQALPGGLGGGKLATLFQPQPSTRPLLRLMLAATGSERPGPKRTRVRRIVAMPTAFVAAFPWASLKGTETPRRRIPAPSCSTPRPGRTRV